MSTGSLAKTNNEYWQFVCREYWKEHPGAFRAPDMAAWAVSKGLVDDPKMDPRRELVRRAKRAMREARIKDSQGRSVREMLPASSAV